MRHPAVLFCLLALGAAYLVIAGAVAAVFWRKGWDGDGMPPAAVPGLLWPMVVAIWLVRAPFYAGIAAEERLRRYLERPRLPKAKAR